MNEEVLEQAMPQEAEHPNTPEHIVEYYSDAGPDYEAWSGRFNMHFGFWRPGINPLRRETMLEEMNEQVLARLQLDARDGARLLDMGCGLGATLRHAAATRPTWKLKGISLVPWQIEQAKQRSAAYPGIGFERADYTATPYPTASFDGAWALESSCHAPGLGKEAFLAEAARLIKPGGRLVIADGFLKRCGPMHPLYRYCYERTCANWALETFAGLEAFTDALRRQGFEEIRVEEISWKILPSVLQVPWVTLKYFLLQLFHPRHRMNRESWRHIGACVLSPVVGMARKRFGYYLVTAIRTG